MSVKNEIVFSNPFDKGEFKKRFFSENNLNETFFDFDNLIPLPKSLMLQDGIITDIALRHYREIPSQNLKFYLDSITPKLFKNPKFEWDYDSFIDGYSNVIDFMSEEVQKIIAEKESYTIEESLMILHDIGKILDDNIVKYGFPTWSGWCLFNWGTEWLPSNGDAYDNTVVFTTRDNPPIPIYRKLCFLGYNFNVRYADNMGHDCGVITACDCFIHQDKFGGNSKSGRDIFEDLWAR